MVLLSSFYSIIYMVLAIFGILALGGLSGKEHEEKKRPLDRKLVQIKYRELPDPVTADVFHTYVGGARFYCDKNDHRTFVGFVYFDPEDEAPRIYRNDMRMMGHIPRESLKEYKAWCPGDTWPCVGYVLRGPNAEKLDTEVKIIKPYNQSYVTNEIKKYITWVVQNRGADTAPAPDTYSPLI